MVTPGSRTNMATVKILELKIQSKPVGDVMVATVIVYIQSLPFIQFSVLMIS